MKVVRITKPRVRLNRGIGIGVELLALILCLSALASAQARPSAVSFAGIGVEINDQTCTAKLRASPQTGLLSKKVSHFSLTDPARIVLDVSGLVVASPKKFNLSEQRCVSRVRFGSHEGFGRIVFDLAASESPTYDVLQEGEALVVVFGSGPGKPEAAKLATPSKEAVVPTPRAASESTSPVALISPISAPTVKPEVVTPEIGAAVVSEVNVQPTSIKDKPSSDESTAQVVEPQAPITPTPVALSSEHDQERVNIPVHAQLRFSVDQVLVELPSKSGQHPVGTIVVTNTSDTELRMTARPAAILDAGLESEREENTKELLVSPSMFELLPGAQRRVRVVATSREPPDREQVFRVHLAPVQDDFDTVIQLRKSGTTGKISIVTALAITVLRPSAEDRPEIQSRWLEGHDARHSVLRLENKGERSVGLVSMQVCPPTPAGNERGVRACQDLASRRLFAGGTLELTVPRGSSVQGLQKVGAEFQALKISESSLQR